MRVPNKWAQAQINLKEWWPAKGVTPQIFEKVWKMVIIWERYIEHNNRYSP